MDTFNISEIWGKRKMASIFGKCKNKSFTALLLALLMLFVAQHSLLPMKSAEASEPEQTLTFTPINVTYTQGYSSSGSYVDTCVSDDVYHKSTGRVFRFYDWEYGRVFIYVLEVVYLFNAGKSKSIIPNISKIEVNGEARTNTATTSLQTVALSIYNYKSGLWEQIGDFYGCTTDAWLSWNDIATPLDYMDNQGNMKLKWHFCSIQPDFKQLWIDFQCIKLTLKPFKWTFMVYLDADWIRWYLDPETGHKKAWIGDSDATADINEMELVGSTGQVAVIVQVDWYYSSKGVDRYFITKDDGTTAITSPKLEHLSEVNMGNASTITDFVNWSINCFPAEHYSLAFWDHGQGVKQTCEDAHPEDSLSMAELKSGLSDAKTATGKTINLIGFMACVMQMAEVAYQIKDYGNVLVASEEAIRADVGWRFDYILGNLTNAPDMTEIEFGEVIVEAYKRAAHGTIDPFCPPTFSSVDLTRMNYLAARIDDFAYCLITKLNSTRSQIEDCRNQAQDFLDMDFIDLYNFTKATLDIGDPEILNAANALLYEINQTVLYEWHANGTDTHGTSIYFPRYQTRYDDTMYEPLDMSIDYRWDDFLRAYLSA